MRLARGRISAMIAALLVSAMPMTAAAEPPAAFARASPLPVSPDPSLKNPVPTEFQFGRSYEVLEQTPKFVKLVLPDGKSGYVTPAAVMVSEIPSWVSTSTLFSTTNRPNLRLWKEADALKGFLEGNIDRPWDFEELLDVAPRFSMRLPVKETTTAKSIGGARDVTLVTALVPLPGDAAQDVKNIKDGQGLRTNVHVVADVSGSTKEFLEPAVRQIADLLSRNDLKNLIGQVTLTRYATSLPSLAQFSGPFSILDFAKQDLRKAAIAGGNDAEPLLTALATATEATKGLAATSTALIILSGADVNPDPITVQGATITPEKIALPDKTTTFVVQITPEPGESMSKMVRGLTRTRLEYVPYGENAVRSLGVKVAQLFDENRKQAISGGAFKKLGSAARAANMIPILPREMDEDNTNFPPPPSFAPNAAWYAVPLNLAVDGLVFKVGR